MRISLNPNKDAGEITPPDVSLCVATHLTDHPYHASRFEVIDRCLRTMVEGAKGYNCEIIVWDNGSTSREFDEYLTGVKGTVVFSPNVGLDNAKANLCAIARGRIFCYSDDDIEFSADWLWQQIEILETYPNVGLVSGSPIKAHFKWGIESVKRVAEDAAFGASWGDLISDEWGQDYCRSVGRDWDEYEGTNKDVADILLNYNGVPAWGHGHHMQFTAYRDVIQPFLEKQRNNRLIVDQKPFDIAVDQAGLLRLTTYQRTALHIGNIL